MTSSLGAAIGRGAGVTQRMRWRRTFIAEVSEKLQQLGMTACPVCGSAESLGAGRFPVLLVDGEFPQGTDGGHLVEDRDLHITFAMQIECTTCGHLMLFNAERYRTGDEKILVLGPTEEEQRQPGE